MTGLTIHAGVIDAEAMFPPMLEACPSFRPVWDAHEAAWSDERQPMHDLALADLARHLIGQLERGETGGFGAVFAVVERWHVEGDAYVREAASIGLLESLQNTGLHGATAPDDFLGWLQPESLRCWRKIEDSG
jgi:hypothetical protein